MIINNDKAFINSQDLESQEHLSLKRLIGLKPKYHHSYTADRPVANFIDLANWAQDIFAKELCDTEDLSCYINNRIVIDGQFFQFAETNDVKVECLHRDSIISWQSDNGLEKFFIQGIFLIKSNNFEFLHCALFHKGNQNEDEISFFVICSKDNYCKYIEFRNEFDAWILQRDRGNLHIKVIDADDIPYTRDQSWEDLFLPQTIKEELQSIVEGFLDNKNFYLENQIPWKRGILMYGEPGNGKTSIIKTVIANYNFKPVTIIPGANDELVREAFAYAEEQSPSLLYFEDLDSLLEKSVDLSSFLNLMDGISAKNGLLVIATANNIKKLPLSITDRPSRFDRKFEIPLPDQQTAVLYLKKWFGKMIPIVKIRELAKHAVKYKFSYAYLKELYISSMFEALANNRKAPSEKDISKALDRIIKDKNLKSGRVVNTEKYFQQK